MKVGVLADVHGNLPALEAVLEDAGDVEVWLCAGDLVGHLPFPDEVVAKLDALGALCVRGNHDHALLEGLDIPGSRSGTIAIRDHRARVSAETRALLAALPARRDVSLGGLDVTLVHGSPRDPLSERLYEMEFEITLRNHKESPITVEVNEPIGGDWQMVDSTYKWTKTSAFAAQFNVPVAKDGTSVLRYRVRVRW